MPEQGPTRRMQRPALFICDIQEKFRKAVSNYDHVIQTTQKLLKFASILSIPIYITTQDRKKLGETCSEITTLLSSCTLAEDSDKTAFSMYTPSIARHFSRSEPAEIIIVGIESHICVTQTALDFLREGHRVYVVADGVSSCNPQEVPLALARLRAEGAVVTSSESLIYECMGDAIIPEFRAVAGLVKEHKATTEKTMATLLSKI